MRVFSVLGITSIFLTIVSGQGMCADVTAESGTVTQAQAKDFSSRYGSMPGAANTATPKSVEAEPVADTKPPPRAELIATRTAIPNSTEINSVVEHYGSLPGGIVMEGAAKGLDSITSVRYDAKTQTLILGDDLAFRPEATTEEIASLARALTEDDRVGVSITNEDVIAFGSIPEETTLARNLAVADIFLVDFVVPPREWTQDYRLAGGYTPSTIDTEDEIVAFYTLHDFEFVIAGGEVTLSKAKANLFVVPVLSERADDGGYLPDLAALDAGTATDTLAAVQKNADHMTANFSYYAQERAARRAITLGEVAAVLRHLKSKGVDLTALADEMDEATAEAATDEDWGNLDVAWSAYLREIQTAGDFANWSLPPFDQYMSKVEARQKAELATPPQ